MTINRCRVCGQKFLEKPLLRYDNMPAVAQYLPDKKSLEQDKGIRLDICQCSYCGLVQLSNNPVPYYKEVIRAVGVSPEMKAFRMKQFKSFIAKYSLKGKKVVEIGCGRGDYLSIMKQAGADAWGIEQSAESVSYCVKNGLNVSKGYVESSTDRIIGAQFQAFYILNFLEHFPDPNSALRGIHNNLTEGAVGIVEVPNFDMILSKNLFSEFTGDHLLYFTKETLETTLKLNGFEVIECNVVWHDYIISATVKKRKKLDITHFYEYQEKLKTNILRYIHQFNDREVAIWGAGHQALALISMMDLAGMIRYVVDSATFKQGKFTPATHTPIVGPERLDSDPVKAILVMAASYSDEVAGIIREKYGNKIKVAILRDYGLEVI